MKPVILNQNTSKTMPKNKQQQPLQDKEISVTIGAVSLGSKNNRNVNHLTLINMARMIVQDKDLKAHLNQYKLAGATANSSPDYTG